MWISHLHLLMDHSFPNGLLTSGPDLEALFAFERERERALGSGVYGFRGLGFRGLGFGV